MGTFVLAPVEDDDLTNDRLGWLLKNVYSAGPGGPEP